MRGYHIAFWLGIESCAILRTNSNRTTSQTWILPATLPWLNHTTGHWYISQWVILTWVGCTQKPRAVLNGFHTFLAGELWTTSGAVCALGDFARKNVLLPYFFGHGTADSAIGAIGSHGFLIPLDCWVATLTQPFQKKRSMEWLGTGILFWNGSFLGFFMEWITTIVLPRKPNMHKTAFPQWNGNEANIKCWNKEHPIFMEWNGSHRPGVTIRYLKIC